MPLSFLRLGIFLLILPDFSRAVDAPQILHIDGATTTPTLGYTVLDTRERREYEVSHLKQARWVGYNDFSLARVRGVSKHAKILLYCSVGYRSHKVAEKLMAAGYQNVTNMDGGIFSWVNSGKKVFDMQGNSTERIHAYDRLWGLKLTRGIKVYD
jgi:rhodanese-related sulfurtransferase